ncbi:hypothetical protein AOQ65_09310 [Bacteroides fragilis]|nr:hypothetical protein AOQ65_09310 [Bacteroides fragilis]OCM96243.1 hypothetical protein AE749_17955 [Bacteroides fragilis]
MLIIFHNEKWDGIAFNSFIPIVFYIKYDLNKIAIPNNTSIIKVTKPTLAIPMNNIFFFLLHAFILRGINI